MYFVSEGQHSQARSAWDSATPKEPSRRVRYDRAGVRTDSKIGERKFEYGIATRLEMIPEALAAS